ncbi:MAG: hypothetical protein WCQ66_10280 [Sphaerochaetaceae bacterium]
MCTLLVAINPVHVGNIMAGKKKYEYRKVMPSRCPARMLIYSTWPEMKVVGVADIDGILEGEPSKIWSETKLTSGITKQFFDEYYSGHKKAVAYRLSNVVRFKEPKSLESYGIRQAPQSFVYLHED